MYNTSTMGQNVESGGYMPREELNKLKLEMVRENVRGTLETIFKEGAMISHDGKKTYYNFNPQDLPPESLEDYNKGKIASCLPQEANIKHEGVHPSRLHVIPPDSDKKLTYDYGKNASIHIRLLLGLDESGNPITESLWSNSSAITAFKELTRNKLLSKDLDPSDYKPKTITNELLRDIADTGLGEYNRAIEKLREENLSTSGV